MKSPVRVGLFLAGMAALAARLPLGAAQVDQPVSFGKDGKLAYVADAKGNRVPDFSSAGYGGGGVRLPEAAAVVVVSPVDGEDGGRIQAAIDYVSGLAPGPDGLRGAVVLAKGRYEIAGQLRISVGGVVLRGSGSGSDGTVLVATGTDRRSLIEIHGRADRTVDTKRHAVQAAYVPVGAIKIQVADAGAFKAGDLVRIERPSTKEWLQQLGMHEAPARSGFFWRPGTVNVAWDRTVLAVSGDELTLDAPLTTALEAGLGGGTVAAYRWPGRIERVGVEHLRCDSAYDGSNPKDEQHSWMAVHVDAVRDAWIRDVVTEHFASSAVYLAEGASRITVQDCASLSPVSELAGYRRVTFFTAGQQTLFLRCRAEEGRNDFVAGYLAAGPNVFLECLAAPTHGFSGSIGSWASGLLFDNVNIDGGELRLDNLETWNQGVGWSTANSVVWQSKASRLICRIPPGAANWASGVWAMFVGDGIWSMTSEFVKPDSLYRAQLEERLGKKALEIFGATATPPVSEKTPLWERIAAQVRAQSSPATLEARDGLSLDHGWLTARNRLLVGREQDTTWWRGQLNPARTNEVGPNLTRFVPGRTGPGLTDDLVELADSMQASNRVVLRHHWGLWYDRRSDDHQMIRRPDADVWPPFYEQPWLRSGKGEAWDRLSQYDLSRYNPWYFGRLRSFAAVCRERRLVLVDDMYFQHNILEAGAHWASFPWRSANNVQAVGFPEPPPYVGDKRIFMAEAFYDLSHPVRRELHRAYIRQCLANLQDEPNVIHLFGAEFSGPLSFMRFWLDTVAEWEAETGRKPLIGLSAPKDVQDAILDDPQRSRIVSVIDFTYWWRTDKGLYAPPGGANLSPRQEERKWRGGRPSGPSLAAMAREYRERFPEKAIITGLDQSDGWAFAAAGGSLPALPSATDPRLLEALARMSPVKVRHGNRTWVLGEADRQYFVYSYETRPTIDLGASSGSFRVLRVDAKTGAVQDTGETVAAGGSAELKQDGPGAFWLTR
ncbi:pectate lyase [Opitutaceae bacterium EW11]|nr:pectate lyase [Opitutaceae bacterium EW11]